MLEHGKATYQGKIFYNSKVINDIENFKRVSDVIVANRMNAEIEDVREKVYTRDLYERD